jgi:class 3 adenylate cyclase
VYEVLGLPPPDPAAPLAGDEEELLAEFMRTWSLAVDPETLVRAARLAADGTRMAAIGWPDLYDEQVAGAARGRLARGEVDEFPREVVEGGVALVALLPRLLTWLTHRYVEERIVAGIVENFEEVLAFDGRTARRVPPTAQRAVVFADVSGYTNVTEERGDEAAVRIASALQRQAEEVALRHGGRLVKLLGDGAMLYFREPAAGVEACMNLVDALGSELGVAAHAGIHAGPVIERDRDIYGRTVNLAARIAGTAGPSEVVASSDVAEAVELPGIRFQPVGEATLKGVAEPVALFRVVAGA